MNSCKHFCRSASKIFVTILGFWPILVSVQAQPHIVHEIQEQLKTKASDSAQLEMHLELTMQFEYLNPDQVKEHAAAAAALADKLNEPTKAIRAQYQLAVAQYLSGDFALAETTLRKVESKSSFTNEEKSQLDIYNLMGTILTSRDKVREGLTYQFKALELSKLIQDTSRIITALSNIATTYKSNLDTARCRKYYMEALQLAVVTRDTISLAVINNNLSEIMVHPDSILHFADAALSAFRDLEYKDGIAHSSNQFGVGLMARKDFRRAIPYFHVALNIWTPSSYRPGISSAATNLATSYGYLRKADSLAHYASLAEKIGIELEDKTILKESFGKFARMYEETGKTALALQYLKRAVELQDLLYSNERAKQFANAETSFNTREKERELIEKELTIAQQKSTKKNYLILLAIILLLAIASIQYLLMRQKIRKKIDALELEKERHASEKLRELDQLKGKFFADISHEFRTPLTLIQTPLRQAIQKTRPGDLVLLPQHLAHQMHKSSEDLLSLVNQLLDLAKLEDGRMNLEISNSDIAQFIKATVYSFESLAISKEITLLVNIGEFDFDTWFDRKKLFHILTNLLSNAIKFTETGGQIAIDAMILKDEILEIAVHDTGRGISEEILPHIFDRFTSLGAEGESVRSTGIGLALTSELVKLHQGTISVTSTSDSGTTFTVRLPIKKSAFPNATIVNSSSNYAPATRNREEVLPDDKKSQVFHVEAPVVLLVEDNIELLHFTKEILSSEFKVDTAQNGREGLEKARATIPDLIITDVMMPELDGILFSKEIRESPQTSHIPIIMLTAKADRRDKIRGLKLGVDDYLTKPFDSTELLVRAQNLIHQRKQLLKRFSTKSFFQPSDIASTPVDEIFLNQVMCTIEKELANPNFGVEDLSKSVSFSRSQLHRKLKALTDKSPNELIRNFRLERARELLRDKSGTASEIAYQVGFSSLPYFSKCFKDQFGISPSEV